MYSREREHDLALAAPRPAGRGVEHEVADLQRRLGGSWLAAAQQRPQPRQQLVERERLGQVVVGTGVQAVDLVLQRVLGGQHQHQAWPALAPQRRADLHPVHPGQHAVEDDDGVVVAAAQLEPVLAMVGDLDRIAFGLESAPHEAGDARVVLDQQYLDQFPRLLLPCAGDVSGSA